jgi:hypothetical protein
MQRLTGPAMRAWTAAFIALIALSAIGPARAAARLLDYGMYATGGETNCDFSSAIGYCALQRIDHVATATDIPGALGVSFGIHYALGGGPTAVRSVLFFPPAGLKNPRFPAPAHSYTHDESCDGSDCYDLYALDFPWEVVEGIWTFQIWANGNLVLEKKFRVVLPDKKKPKKAQGRPIASL